MYFDQWMPFASWNHLFLHKNKFFCLFQSLTEKKKKRKESAKITQKTCMKWGYLEVNQHLRVTLKAGRPPFMTCFLLIICISYIFDWKRWKYYFNQQTACGAPVSWSKYTTVRASDVLKGSITHPWL